MTNNDSALAKSNKKEEKAGQKFDIDPCKVTCHQCSVEVVTFV
jgi:hypothetical protein